MSPRASNTLVAAVIRIGLLLALAIMLMAENAQAQRVNTQRVNVASTRSIRPPGRNALAQSGHAQGMNPVPFG
jgi:hypothetical protein